MESSAKRIVNDKIQNLDYKLDTILQTMTVQRQESARIKYAYDKLQNQYAQVAANIKTIIDKLQRTAS